MSSPLERMCAEIPSTARQRWRPPAASMARSSSSVIPDVGSLRGEQPPVARLAALVQLELDAFGRMSLELAERDRRTLSSDDREDLGALGEPGDRLRQGRSGAPPGNDLVAHESDGVTGDEPAL